MKHSGSRPQGMLALHNPSVDVIANNIANANTTGFKAFVGVFSDLVIIAFASAGSLTSGRSICAAP